MKGLFSYGRAWLVTPVTWFGLRLGTLFIGAAFWLLLFIPSAFPAEIGADGTEFFEKKVRPILSEHCYECHSARSQKLRGKLMLDSRAGILRGGESGPAMLPGDPDKSLLIKAVRYADLDLQMPPKNQKLSNRQINVLTTWVAMGAPWPVEDKTVVARAKASDFEITVKDRAYWAFQLVRRPPVPVVKHAACVANPIDAFVLAELEAKALSPNPPASRREWVRRVYFDLLGLPPSPEQVVAFERDKSPHAAENLVDQLLSRPQYGERWARHWLDVVRFAQSNGYERDGEKPFAWRYRDYVIQALNQDKPYERFILEQIAGDELPDAAPEAIVATGFQRLGVWDDEPDDKRMAEFDQLDDIVSTTSTAFLGLTMGCARCHDHKFDPISQADYYQFLSFFRNLRPYEDAKYTLDSPNYAPLASPEKVRAWQTDHKARMQALEAQLPSAPAEEKKKIQEQLGRTRAESPPFEWALAAREHGSKPPPTHILIRGNAGSPGPEVQPAFLTVLGGEKPALPAPDTEAPSSGRRLALAKWLASPQNPLTARVMVNRLWQHHFGNGIVTTTTDFGRAGIPPTKPKLLDWLAAEFMEGGWSLKRLHRLILLSNTYRMSSHSQNLPAERLDPGNDLLWRQNLRRLEAEPIRDSILRITGQLNPAMGGRGFFPHLGGEVLAGASRPGLDWQKCSVEDCSRRSIYTYIRRTVPVPALEVFDYSNTTSPLGERAVTAVAPQALWSLNDEFMQQQSAAFASRLLSEIGAKPQRQVRRGYQLAFNREPTRRELQVGLDFIKRQTVAFQALASRLTFRPDVPSSLSVEYMKQLAPEDFVVGPRAGWTYHRGAWSAAYEGIRTMDRARGPFALWRNDASSNCVVEAELVLDRAAEAASLLVRATAEGDELRGYEVNLDPRRQRLMLRRHGTNLADLSQAAAAIPTAQPFPIRIEAAGARLRVWLDHSTEPAIDYTDAQPVRGAGWVGVRTSGAMLSVDHLALFIPERGPVLRCSGEPDDGCSVAGVGSARSETAKSVPGPSKAERQALQSFCLLLLNLNELIYID